MFDDVAQGLQKTLSESDDTIFLASTNLVHGHRLRCRMMNVHCVRPQKILCHEHTFINVLWHKVCFHERTFIDVHVALS